MCEIVPASFLARVWEASQQHKVSPVRGLLHVPKSCKLPWRPDAKGAQRCLSTNPQALLKACRDDESSAEDWIPAHVLDGEFGVYDIASQQLWEVLFHDVGFGA